MNHQGKPLRVNIQILRVLILGISITFILGSFEDAYAATITSTAAGGAWEATTTWVGGVVPVAGDDVVIAAGSTVIATGDKNIKSLDVKGTLEGNNNNITVKNGITISGTVQTVKSLLSDDNGITVTATGDVKYDPTQTNFRMIAKTDIKIEGEVTPTVAAHPLFGKNAAQVQIITNNGNITVTGTVTGANGGPSGGPGNVMSGNGGSIFTETNKPGGKVDIKGGTITPGSAGVDNGDGKGKDGTHEVKGKLISMSLPSSQIEAGSVTMIASSGVVTLSDLSTAAITATEDFVFITTCPDGVVDLRGNLNSEIIISRGEIIINTASILLDGGTLLSDLTDPDAIVNPCPLVGGEPLPIETTSLLLAGSKSFSWMIPVVLSGIGIGLFVVSRKSENS